MIEPIPIDLFERLTCCKIATSVRQRFSIIEDGECLHLIAGARW